MKQAGFLTESTNAKLCRVMVMIAILSGAAGFIPPPAAEKVETVPTVHDGKTNFASRPDLAKASPRASENGSVTLTSLDAWQMKPIWSYSGAGTEKPTPSSGTGGTITNSIGMKLVYIPPGEFMMGSPPSEIERNSDEGPQHRVKITNGFYMGTTEVTQFQYKKVMNNNHICSFRGYKQ